MSGNPDGKVHDTRNCPMCGKPLLPNLSCTYCGGEVTQRANASSSDRRWIIPLFIVLLALLAVLSYYFSQKNRVVQANGFIEVQKGVDDNRVYVPVDSFETYRNSLDRLRQMRKKRADLETEKLLILGNIGEERRIERLIVNLNNEISVLTDELRRLERENPDAP